MRTMLDWIRFALSAVLTVFGLFVLVTATLGLFRFHYVLNRIHATALADTLAVLTILAGARLGFYAGYPEAAGCRGLPLAHQSGSLASDRPAGGHGQRPASAGNAGGGQPFCGH